MKVTVRTIQNTLRAAGHMPSRKERYSLSTTGHVVEKCENGITVSHIVSAIVGDEMKQRMALQAVKQYASALQAAGYTVQIIQAGNDGPCLKVQGE